MNKPKCTELDYINFLIASQRLYSCTEAERVLYYSNNPASHDAFNRILYRVDESSEALWEEAKIHICLKKGLLVYDDSTLDKLYAQKIELVGYHWSGKHHAVIKGINLGTLIWTDGDRIIPCDYAVYDKTDEQHPTKHHLFRTALKKAKERGFEPECVGFDSWYAALDNLKYIRELGWIWLTRLHSNRQVNFDRQGNVPLEQLTIESEGLVVHLKGYGMIKVFKTVSKKGDVEYWATNNLDMTEIDRLSKAEKTWGIEMYHRGLKQCCGVEKCQARKAKAQKNHILLSIRAFLRLENYSWKTGIGWICAKAQIIRDAVARFLDNPTYEKYFKPTA